MRIVRSDFAAPRSLLPAPCSHLNTLHRADAARAGRRQAPRRTLDDPRRIEVLRHDAHRRHADAERRRQVAVVASIRGRRFGRARRSRGCATDNAPRRSQFGNESRPCAVRQRHQRHLLRFQRVARAGQCPPGLLAGRSRPADRTWISNTFGSTSSRLSSCRRSRQRFAAATSFRSSADRSLRLVRRRADDPARRAVAS